MTRDRMASSLARPPALRMSGIAFCQTRELRRVKTGVHTTSMIAIRRWLSAVVRIRSTPLVEHVHGRCVSRRDVVHDIFEIKYGVGLPLLIPVSGRISDLLKFCWPTFLFHGRK